MNSNHTHHQQPIEGPSQTFWRSRYGIGLLVFGAVAAYFLLAEHRAHLFGAWPFLLLLACPLVHMFMHGSHGSHQGGTVDAGTPEIQSKEKP